MEAQRSLETVESCSPHSQLLAWPEFQGLTPARWGPGLASLERPHSVLGSWGLSLADSLLISHMQVPQRLCSQLPEVRALAWLQRPWWEAPKGLYRLMAPSTRGQQGFTSSQSGPELSGGLPEGGSISQVPQQPLRQMRALSTMGCTGCGSLALGNSLPEGSST